MRVLKIVLVNEDTNTQFSEWTEPLSSTYMGEDATKGEIFLALQKEYGRCTSKIYFEYTSRADRECGWYFVKRDRLSDTGESYLRGAWVMLLTQPEGNPT